MTVITILSQKDVSWLGLAGQDREGILLLKDLGSFDGMVNGQEIQPQRSLVTF